MEVHIPKSGSQRLVSEIVRARAGGGAHNTVRAEKCILSSTKTPKIAKIFAAGAKIAKIAKSQNRENR